MEYRIKNGKFAVGLAGLALFGLLSLTQPHLGATDKSVRNVVLVHGAWAGPSSWSKVVPILESKGYFVTAVELPLKTLDEDVAVTRPALASQQGSTVLVGHSYGGAVITGAATGEASVSALVYIAAFAPDEGESLDSLSKQGPAPPGAAYIHPDGNGLLQLDAAAFPRVFAGDLSSAEAARLIKQVGPLGVQAFTGKSGVPAWKSIRSWYLVSANDEMIPPQAEAFMAQRIGATVKTVAASHASLVSRPGDVADMIMQAAEAGPAK